MDFHGEGRWPVASVESLENLLAVDPDYGAPVKAYTQHGVAFGTAVEIGNDVCHRQRFALKGFRKVYETVLLSFDGGTPVKAPSIGSPKGHVRIAVACNGHLLSGELLGEDCLAILAFDKIRTEDIPMVQKFETRTEVEEAEAIRAGRRRLGSKVRKKPGYKLLSAPQACLHRIRPVLVLALGGGQFARIDLAKDHDAISKFALGEHGAIDGIHFDWLAPAQKAWANGSENRILGVGRCHALKLETLRFQPELRKPLLRLRKKEDMTAVPGKLLNLG